MSVKMMALGSQLLQTSVFLLLLLGLLRWRQQRGLLPRPGWNALLVGLGLISLESFLTLSEGMGRGSGGEGFSLWDKDVVWPVGYLLLLLGLVRWLPAVQQLSSDAHSRQQAKEALEAEVAVRTASLRTTNASLKAEVTRRREMEAALDKARARLEYLLTVSPAVIYSCQPQPPYGIRFLSTNVHALLGYRPEEFVEAPQFWEQRIHPKDRDRVLAERGEHPQGNELSQEYRFRQRDGSYCWLQDTLRWVGKGEGKLREVIGYWTDITERKQAEQTQRRLSAIVEASTDFVGFADPQGQTLYLNPAGRALVGIGTEAAVGQSIRTFSPAWANAIIQKEGLPEARRQGQWRGETALRHRDGTEIPISQIILAHNTPEGELEFFSTIARDIRERKAYEAQLEYRAHYDPLTGLPNRHLLADRLVQALARAQRHSQSLAVLFMDLDRFKMINDSLGHEAGDALLKAAADRLRGCVRAEDTVARLGGDEFVLVLEGLEGAERGLVVARKVLRALQTPFTLEGQSFCINTSIGFSLFPRDGATPAALLKSADTALSWAKGEGRGCIRGYMPGMNTQVVERLSLEQGLRWALARSEFYLEYQPLVELQHGSVVGVEALLRWRHPQRGLIPPETFIPLAEELGLMLAVGEWVLRSACAQLRCWQAAGFPALTMAVNLSTRQFIQADLVERVARILHDAGVAPACLALEITESQIMQDVEGAMVALEAFRSMQVHLSIDDFGTGYSSLRHLQRFPLNRLKIGKDFVQEIGTEAGNVPVVEAVIALAHSLGLKVVAEGVETEAQLQFLREHGCEEMQGYYFSPPLSPAAMGALLEEKRCLSLPPLAKFAASGRDTEGPFVLKRRRGA